MAAAPPDRRGVITEALRKIDDLSARLEIAEKGDTEQIFTAPREPRTQQYLQRIVAPGRL